MKRLLALFYCLALAGCLETAATEEIESALTEAEVERMAMEQGRFMLCTQERKVGLKVFVIGSGDGTYPSGLTEDRVRRLVKGRLQLSDIDHTEVENTFPFPKHVELVVSVFVNVHPPVPDLDLRHAFAGIEIDLMRPLENPLGFDGVGTTAAVNSIVWGDTDRILQSIQEDVEDLIMAYVQVHKDPLCRSIQTK